MFCGSLGLIMLLAGALLAQPLDWARDVTIFGTTADEDAPALAMAPGAPVLHAFCVAGDSVLCMKRSRDGGETWSALAEQPATTNAPRVLGAADGFHCYALLTGAGRTLYRFPPSAASWEEGAVVTVAPERTGEVLAAALFTDAANQPADPYLSVCWIERDAQGTGWSAWFAQSQNLGQSFGVARAISNSPSRETDDLQITVCAAWTDDEERLVAAMPIDRPGSVAEQIRLRLSADQGDTWQEEVVLDSSAWAQESPALAAAELLVFCVYARRLSAQNRDVYYAWSLDGGLSFAPIAPVASAAMRDEYQPRLAVDVSAGQFHVFYLADSGASTATLYLRTGSFGTPWELSPPVALCEAGEVVAERRYSVTNGAAGTGAAWVSRFELGDTDIRFDGSWRTAGVPSSRPACPAQAALGVPYPNPFNGTTRLSLVLANAGPARLVVTDLLGRTVRVVDGGVLGAGEHRVTLALPDLPSGNYWVKLEGQPSAPRRLVLIR